MIQCFILIFLHQCVWQSWLICIWIEMKQKLSQRWLTSIYCVMSWRPWWWASPSGITSGGHHLVASPCLRRMLPDSAPPPLLLVLHSAELSVFFLLFFSRSPIKIPSTAPPGVYIIHSTLWEFHLEQLWKWKSKIYRPYWTTRQLHCKLWMAVQPQNIARQSRLGTWMIVHRSSSAQTLGVPFILDLKLMAVCGFNQSRLQGLELGW